ncbi:MAG: hypothetical protein P1V35_02825 [Planctomycetota bacterium]|nr:hypothetical protein [Planctomycetota bacterium]
MKHQNKPLIAVLFALFGLAACGPVDFQGQDLALRHDVENNVLELNLTYHGVMAAGSGEDAWSEGRTKEIAKAVEAVEGMAGDRRDFMLIDSFFRFDLDDMETDLHSQLGAEDPGDAQRYLDIVKRFTVKPSQVYLDDMDRIAIHQQIRIDGAIEATAELNKAIHKGLLLWTSEGGSLEKETAGMLDASTANAWIAEAKTGEPWIFWKEQTLVLSVPMSPQSAANLVKSQVSAVAAEQEMHVQKTMSNLIGMISEVQLKDGRLSLRIGPDKQGFLNLRFEQDDRDYLPGLKNAMEAKGFKFMANPAAKH